MEEDLSISFSTKELTTRTTLYKTESAMTWKIRNFMSLLSSPKEVIGDQGVNFSVLATTNKPSEQSLTEWRVFLGDPVEGWLGIFFRLTGEPPETSSYVTFDLIILGETGSGRAVFSHKRRPAVRINAPGFQIGCDRVVEKSQASLLPLRDGALWIELRVHVIIPMFRELHEVSSFTLFEAISRELLVNQMRNLTNQKSPFNDVKIISKEGSEHFTNKLFLSVRCPKLAEIADLTVSKDNVTVLKMEGLTRVGVAVLLHFVHTGELIENERGTVDDLLDVAIAAKEYGLPGVHEFCDSYLENEWRGMRLSVDNYRRIKASSGLPKAKAILEKYLRPETDLIK